MVRHDGTPPARAPGAQGRRSQADRSATTRQGLIDAAVELFAEQGYEGTRIEEIAERAGVSKGAIYYHFGDKLETFAAVFEHMCQRMTARLIAVEYPDDPIDLLRSGCHEFLEACAEPAYRRIALIDGPPALGWERWRAIDLEAGACQLVLGALQHAADRGVIRGDHIEERSQLLLAQLNEAALLTATRADPAATRAAVAALIDEQLEALRVGPPRGGNPPAS